jgi:xanthine dehydrogenase accessory factor
VSPLAWLTDVAALTARRVPCVLITVTEAKGSTPREAGAKMVVSQDEQLGTIGGGNLEHQAIAEARALLAAATSTPTSRDYPLGPTLAQCCGGAVTVLLEPLLPPRRTLHLFGAGHVGREIVAVLAGLPVHVRWIDERASEMPDAVPPIAEPVITSAPVAEMRTVGPDDLVLVLTHSHDLDYEIVRAALVHGRFAYLGLIGSGTKRTRFEKRLLADGIAEREVARLVCPIGLPGVGGKHPREIAVSVAADLLARGISRP